MPVGKGYKGPVHEAVRKSPLGAIAGKQRKRPKAKAAPKRTTRTTASSKVAKNRAAAAASAKAQGFVKNSSGNYVKARTTTRTPAGPSKARRTGYSSPPPKPTKPKKKTRTATKTKVSGRKKGRK